MLGYIGLSPLVVLLESFVLDVVRSVPNVKGEGKVVENIVMHQLVVLLEIVEHCLLVSKEKVIL